MKAEQEVSSAANSDNGKLWATRALVGGSAAANLCKRSPSASPPTSSRLKSVEYMKWFMSSAQFASGQFLRSLPLPGCSAKAGAPFLFFIVGTSVDGVPFSGAYGESRSGPIGSLGTGSTSKI